MLHKFINAVTRNYESLYCHVLEPSVVMIVGVIAGVIIFLVIIVAILVVIYFRRKATKAAAVSA